MVCSGDGREHISLCPPAGAERHARILPVSHCLEVDHRLLAEVLLPGVVDPHKARVARYPGECREGILAVSPDERTGLRVRCIETLSQARDLRPAEDDPPGKAPPSHRDEHVARGLLGPGTGARGDIHVDQRESRCVHLDGRGLLGHGYWVLTGMIVDRTSGPGTARSRDG